MNRPTAAAERDVRDAFFEEVYQAAARDSRVIVLTDDQGAFGVDKLRKDFPERCLNVGVAEQNLINVAAGLAMGAMHPVVYGITNFVSLRCCEQIAVNLCFPRLPVTIVASGGGLTYASDGPTHHAVQDVGVLRTMPGLAVYNPSDAGLTAAVAREALSLSFPAYVRLEKGMFPVLHSESLRIEAGFAQVAEGEDVVLVSTGYCVHEALKASSILRQRGVEAAVVDMFRLKPVDSVALAGVLRTWKHVVVLEEQAPTGGVADIVARIAVEAGLSLRMKALCLPEGPCYKYGSRDWLHREFGLDPEAVAETVLQWLGAGV